jgi:hypothetical protein
MTAETRHLTITLTGRAPVRVLKADWPILASATGDSCAGNDCGRYQQALGQGECDRYRLTVRQHEDGRAVVYGVLDAAIVEWHAPAGGEDHRGGELLDAGADLAAAIRRVGESCHLPDPLIRDCAADLPAVEI